MAILRGIKKRYDEDDALFFLVAVAWLCVIIFYAVMVYKELPKLDAYLASPPDHESITRKYVVEETASSKQTTINDIAAGQAKPDPNKKKYDTQKEVVKSEKMVEFRSFNDPDIAAQEGMWKAANFLVYLTFGQLVAGFFTLFFLIWAFLTQREELKEVRKANLLEYMPYISIGNEPNAHTEVHGANESFSVRLSFDVINTGKTAATDFGWFRAKNVIGEIKEYPMSNSSKFVKLDYKPSPERMTDTPYVKVINPGQTEKLTLTLVFNCPAKRFIEEFSGKYSSISEFIGVQNHIFKFEGSFRFRDITCTDASDFRYFRFVAYKNLGLPDNPLGQLAYADGKTIVKAISAE